MNKQRVKLNQKKIILSPALRMETETQAIERKLEELKKSLKKKKKDKFNTISEKSNQLF